MSTQSIKVVLLAKAFGSPNLYQDATRAGDTNHLESKLACLERDASVILTRLHVAMDQLDDDTFTISRTELELLRKFLFIMHYRQQDHNKTYFQEDHPDNADIRDWIRHVKKKQGYTSDHQIWLDGLRYYLDTPHSKIMASSSSSQAIVQWKLVGESLDINTPPDQWHSVAYAKYSTHYFMGIWRASRGSEFVLGDNSYGLWEGTFMGETGLFHIFVISPQIALVLKMTLAKKTWMLPHLENSTLSEHPLAAPRPVYSSSQTAASQRSQVEEPSPALLSKDDRFTYTIHTLSVHQTYLVNQVVLSNLQPDGMLAFASKQAMLQTARFFDTPPGPGTLSKANRKSIQTLSSCLSKHVSHVNNGYDMHTLLLPHDKPSSPSEHSEVDAAFDILLRQVLCGKPTFADGHDRAEYICNRLPHPMQSSHPFVQQVFMHFGDEARNDARQRGRPSPSLKTRTVPRPPTSDLLLASLDNVRQDMKCGDLLQEIAGEVGMVLFVHSILEVGDSNHESMGASVDFSKIPPTGIHDIPSTERIQAETLLPAKDRHLKANSHLEVRASRRAHFREQVDITSPTGIEFRRKFTFVAVSILLTLTVSAFVVV